jgi:hypothetical protein
LLQAGVDTGLGQNQNYMWYEMISPQHDSTELVWPNSDVYPGNNVYTYTDYYNGTATFFVEDLTTGVSHSASTTQWDGQAMSAYFDGTTADFITEAPSGGSAPGGLYYLRKPASGSTYYYYYAAVNGNPIADYLSWNINESNRVLMQTTSYNGSTAWRDYWQSCG